MNDLMQLFDRDPLQYTKQDRETIVSELRKAFQSFATGDKKAGDAKNGSKPKVEKKKLSLDEIL